LEPTHGTALIGGYDIRTDMAAIYTLMGVCPQHDLLWETLTGREHLLFYGRLKGLNGAAGQRAARARASLQGGQARHPEAVTASSPDT
jgi:ABC-type multidrug transport system ATPase subunit